MDHTLLVRFLESFFNLFNAKIEKYEIISQALFGTVGWVAEEDSQDFVLKDHIEPSLLELMKLLCDFIYERKFISGDRINVSENDLVSQLQSVGWTKGKAEEAIDGLCDLAIKMLDDGEETDSFFIHF
ncbi:MAG TPA: hypothetical protein VF676_10110 [Flavobacterium sp.]|jgi:hypothetical protein